MNWQLLLVAYLILGTATFLWRRQLAKAFAHHNRLVNAFFFVAVLYPIGLVVSLFTSPDLAIGWTSLLLLLLGGSIFPLSNLLAYRANRDIDAGLFTIISNITPVVSIAAASIFLHETLTSKQLIGAAIILLAAIVVTVPQLKHHMIHNRVAMVFALTAVVIIGLGFVFERYMLTRMDFGAYLVFGWGAQMLWSVGLAWRERHSLQSMLRDVQLRVPLLGYSLSATLRGLCFVGAMALSGNASVVAAWISFLTVMVVLAAYFILKESELLWLKLGGASMGVVGLIMLNI